MKQKWIKPTITESDVIDTTRNIDEDGTGDSSFPLNLAS